MSIKETLRQYVLETLLYTEDESLLDDDDSFVERNIIDSAGVIQLVLFLQDTFGISVADEELLPENLDSINRLTAFVRKKRSAA